MKNVLAMMMVICLTLPANARLNTHKLQPTVKIVNNAAKDENKYLLTSEQIMKGIGIQFLTVMLANWIFYQYAQSNAQISVGEE